MFKSIDKFTAILAPLALVACSGEAEPATQETDDIRDADRVVLTQAAEAGAVEAATHGDSALDEESKLLEAAPPDETDKLKIACAIVSGSRTFARCMGLGSYSASQCAEVAIDLARSVCAD